jgi:hypothetical protein
MSYQVQAQLTVDGDFTGRTSACITQQSQIFVNDTRGDIKALATDWLRQMSSTPLIGVWMPIMAAEPGLADAADNNDGTIDSSKITDQQILTSVQARFPEIAGFIYDQDGNPRP